jgi:hypothetical protein
MSESMKGTWYNLLQEYTNINFNFYISVVCFIPNLFLLTKFTYKISFSVKYTTGEHIGPLHFPYRSQCYLQNVLFIISVLVTEHKAYLTVLKFYVCEKEKFSWDLL